MTEEDFVSPGFTHEWAVRQESPTTTTATLFSTLNAVCGDDGGAKGFARNWFVTIGGGTGQGKSLLAQNLAAYAVKAGKSVGFISLEMSHWQLAARFYAMVSGTPIKDLERGRFKQEAFERVWNVVCDLNEQHPNAHIMCNSEPVSTMDEVIDGAEGMAEAGADLIIVDYLQLVSIGDDESIFKQVTEVASRLRKFAHQRNVTVIGLSQYNTPTGRDTSTQPTLYGLMGGMTLSANSDIVLLLDHSRYERDPLDRHIARTYLLIAKNRHGQVGQIPLLWDYRTLSCREGMPDEEKYWPQSGGKR